MTTPPLPGSAGGQLPADTNPPPLLAACPAPRYGKKPYEQGDWASEPLFTWVKPEALQRSTTKAFISLLDNYERGCGIEEKVPRPETRRRRSS